MEADDWLKFSRSNDEQASIMLNSPIIQNVIYRGEAVVHLDYHTKIGKAYFKVFVVVAIISFPFSALAMHIECLQFVLFFNIDVGGGDNSAQQFVGLLELFYTYEAM